MNDSTPIFLDKTWHFSKNNICSLYESAINFNYSFNVDSAFIRRAFDTYYKPLLIQNKIDSSTISLAQELLITKFTVDSFDEAYLKPNELVRLCDELHISPKIFYDKYYKFIFSNYGKKILKWRNKNNLSQKKAAKLLKVSPVSICSWERNLSYPSRSQYIQISILLL